jgi:hypothetical protein
MEYAPVVSAKTGLVAAPIGKAAHLRCVCESFPAVRNIDDVKWLKDDRLVSANDGYQMSVELDLDMDPYRETSIATLIVTSVSSDTVGSYSCRFNNILGSAEATVKLEVGKPVDPDTGFLRGKASTITVAVATTVAAVAMAVVLMK